MHFIIKQLTCNSSNTHHTNKEIYWFIWVAQLTKLDQPKVQHDTISAYLDGTAQETAPRYGLM